MKVNWDFNEKEFLKGLFMPETCLRVSHRVKRGCRRTNEMVKCGRTDGDVRVGAITRHSTGFTDSLAATTNYTLDVSLGYNSATRFNRKCNKLQSNLNWVTIVHGIGIDTTYCIALHAEPNDVIFADP